ncbi:MAG: protein kinase [Rothia sp. (in: high G+C Gram-positive bacteria)]|nr:protein kinase [Rothia sp. (in: high G+C Gram-positive bacteria)]
MSTPTQAPQTPQQPAPTEQEIAHSSLLPANLADVTPRYRIESGAHHSTWIVDCGYQGAAQLEVQAGPYTLTHITEPAEEHIKAAERLCSINPHPAVLRVDAVTSSANSHHIWYEPAEAGTLADYCQAKGKLPLGQVTAIAQGLTQALSYLHEQGFAYSTLTANHCLLTVRGELKLLAPDLNTRTLTPAVQKSRQAENIAACAALLWFCLTGQEPKTMRLRAPLNLAVPQASEALAQTLEDAIDSRAQQPQLADLLAPIELVADPEPLELHLSAHPSVHSRLPAYRQPETREPHRAIKQRWKTYGQLPDLSQGNTRHTRKQILKKTESKSSWQLPLGKNLQGRGALAGVAVVAALALGGAGYHLFSPTSSSEEMKSEAETTSSPSPPSELAVEPQLAGQPQETEEQQVKTAGLSDDEIALITTGLVATRSTVLASGEHSRIGEYAPPTSPLAKSDQQLLSHEGAARLAGTSTELIAVNEVVTTENGYTLRAIVQANGYSPTGSDQELSAQGISWQDGKVLQHVELSIQDQDGSYLLTQARPLPLTPSTL